VRQSRYCFRPAADDGSDPLISVAPARRSGPGSGSESLPRVFSWPKIQENILPELGSHANILKQARFQYAQSLQTAFF
jgi:hypothetical protein